MSPALQADAFPSEPPEAWFKDIPQQLLLFELAEIPLPVAGEM